MVRGVSYHVSARPDQFTAYHDMASFILASPSLTVACVRAVQLGSNHKGWRRAEPGARGIHYIRRNAHGGRLAGGLVGQARTSQFFSNSNSNSASRNRVGSNPNGTTSVAFVRGVRCAMSPDPPGPKRTGEASGGAIGAVFQGMDRTGSGFISQRDVAHLVQDSAGLSGVQVCTRKRPHSCISTSSTKL